MGTIYKSNIEDKILRQKNKRKKRYEGGPIRMDKELREKLTQINQ